MMCLVSSRQLPWGKTINLFGVSQKEGLYVNISPKGNVIGDHITKGGFTHRKTYVKDVVSSGEGPVGAMVGVKSSRNFQNKGKKND